MDLSGLSNLSQMQRPTPDGFNTPPEKMREYMGDLKTAIEKGDLETVQKAYDAIKAKLPDNFESKSNPASSFLSAVENGLANEDMMALQEASDAMSRMKPQGQSPGAGKGGSGKGAMLGSQMGSSMSGLLEALEDEDEEEAKTAFDVLLETFEDSRTGNKTEDIFREGLNKVNTALEGGNLDQAKSFLEGMYSELPSGTIIDDII